MTREWVINVHKREKLLGIYAPLPEPGDNPRTSDVIHRSWNADLYDLLEKLVDHIASGQAVITVNYRE